MLRQIYRLPAVKLECGLSRSTIYLRISQGLWIKPISLGGRAVGWLASEVKTLIDARVAGKGDEEIRALVKELEVARKNAFSLV